MIKLVYDDVEIVVKPENSLYKTLKRFSGESFTIVDSDEPIVEKKVQEEPAPQIELTSDTYYNLFKEAFDVEFLKSPTGSLLESHLDNVFTSKKVNTSLRGTDADGNKILESTHGFILVML